jgi:hypothetical protein
VREIKAGHRREGLDPRWTAGDFGTYRGSVILPRMEERVVPPKKRGVTLDRSKITDRYSLPAPAPNPVVPAKPCAAPRKEVVWAFAKAWDMVHRRGRAPQVTARCAKCLVYHDRKFTCFLEMAPAHRGHMAERAWSYARAEFGLSQSPAQEWNARSGILPCNKVDQEGFFIGDRQRKHSARS